MPLYEETNRMLAKLFVEQQNFKTIDELATCYWESYYNLNKNSLIFEEKARQKFSS